MDSLWDISSFIGLLLAGGIAPLLVAVLTIFSTSLFFGAVKPISLRKLAEDCELIVVATVESVRSPLFRRRYASAKVAEVWKGPNMDTVEFFASPADSCDISEANKGESVLLFLTNPKGSGPYTIAHHGRGRFPLRFVSGKSFATFWDEVVFPHGTETIDGPETNWEFVRSVDVVSLREMVKKGDEQQKIRAPAFQPLPQLMRTKTIPKQATTT